MFFLIVDGRMNERGAAAFVQLKHDYERPGDRLQLAPTLDLFSSTEA